MATTRTSFPINFDLYNADEEQVLFITDDVAGQEMTLEITNTSDKPTSPKNLTEKASATVHHFELVFRPGTVFNNPAAITLGSTQFSMFMDKDDTTGKIKPNADGTLSLYFKSNTDWTLQEGEKVVIKLNQIRAAAEGGTRGTKVMLKYRDLLHAGNTETFSGFRDLHLSLVNHRGKRNIPLHVGFVGSNTVLNDGEHPNSLRLRVTNVSRKSTTIGAVAISRLHLVLEGGPSSNEWTLARDDQLGGATVKYTHSGVSEPPDVKKVGANEWEIPFAKLDKGQVIDIQITNLITDHMTGHANLFLHYENIPGYWDGEYVAVIEKTPLVFDNKNVGIGINQPAAKLHVEGNLAVNGEIKMNAPNRNIHGIELSRTDEEGRLHMWKLWHMDKAYGRNNFQIWEYRTDKNGISCGGDPKDSMCSPRFTIWEGGNVSIGTENYGAKLTVIPASNKSGVDVLSPSAGNTHLPHESNWHYLSGKGVIFRNFNGNYAEKMRIDLDSGCVGIGTTGPGKTLDIIGPGGLRVSTTNNGSGTSDWIAGNFGGTQGDRVVVGLLYGKATIGAHNNSLNAWSDLILQAGGGNVGIGTTSPNARLHVEGYSFATIGNYGWLKSTGTIGTHTPPTPRQDLPRTISILASHVIVGIEFNARSDERIKNIMGRSNTYQDLEILRQLKVTDYTYIDVEAHGNQRHKKLIAQQVQAVYPQAVNACKDFIPDIYAMSETATYHSERRQLSVTTSKAHALTKGDYVRIADDQGSHEVEVREVKDDRTFIVAHDRSCEEVFVYGKKVDDLLTLDYEEVAMLNVSATQELHRLLEKQQAKLVEQDKRLATLEAENASLRKQMDELCGLKDRMTRIEARFNGSTNGVGFRR